MGPLLLLLAIGVYATGLAMANTRGRWERTHVAPLRDLHARAECTACGWTGPIRDCHRDRMRVYLSADRDRHELECKA